MLNGYGSGINADDFSAVRRFTSGEFSDFNLENRSYSFQELVDLNIFSDSDRIINANLYGSPISNYNFFDGITDIGAIGRGDISATDAPYVHGSVGFALKDDTQFIVQDGKYYVKANIGALNDNFDFDSALIPDVVNDVVYLYSAFVSGNEPKVGGTVYIQYEGEGRVVYYENILGTPDNSILDHSNNFGSNAGERGDGSPDFENGTAQDGGNYETNMDEEVLNGDGAENVVAAGTVTDDYSPGRGTSGSSDGFLSSIGNAFGAIVDGIELANDNQEWSLVA